MNIKMAARVLSIAAVMFTNCGAEPTERENQLRAAANAGDPMALLELGWAFSFGDEDPNPVDMAKPYIIPGIHKDDVEAARLMELAAAKGNATAESITANNYFWKKNFVRCVYWARRAADQGNKGGIEMLSTLRTLAENDPFGTLSPGQRQEIAKALGPRSAEGSESSSPLERAKTESVAALGKICFGGDTAKFSVITAVGGYHDNNVDHKNYPIYAIVSIRFQGPKGMAQRTATFACDQNGKVIAPVEITESEDSPTK